MPINLLKDYDVRFALEATPGSTPAGALQSLVAETLTPSGIGPDRTPTGGVSAQQFTFDNAATTTQTTLALAAPSLYSHLGPFRAACLNQPLAYGSPVTVTGTDIAAVVSGNKLTKVAGTWSTLAKYDIVWVSGQTTNGTGYVAMVSGTPTSTDLPLTWKTLSAESAGASITVKYVGRLVMGSTFTTVAIETWHPVGGYGRIYNLVGVSDWTWGFTIPTEPKESFSLTCGMIPVYESSQLVNTTTPAPARYVHNSNQHFGAKLLTGAGMGFRYGGVEHAWPDLRIRKLEHKVTHPVNTSGAAGVFGPVSAYSDGMIKIDFTLEVMRDSVLAETMVNDRETLGTVASIGFGMIDDNGQKLYRWFPALQYVKGSEGGLTQQGEDFLTFPMVAKADPNGQGMMREFLLG